MPLLATNSRPVLRVGAAFLMLASLPIALSHASAQTLAEQTQRVTRSVAGPARVISVNPFLPLFGYFAGEYEQRVTPSVAVAIAGSHIRPFDEARYTNLDAKVRLYPSEMALWGFNIAASLGVARIRPSTDSYFDCGILQDCVGTPAKEFTTGSFAIEAAYQWLLGPSKVTALTVGGGAKRYLGSERKFQNDAQVIPTMRLSIGYAF